MQHKGNERIGKAQTPVRHALPIYNLSINFAVLTGNRNGDGKLKNLNTVMLSSTV
jgi:hypothetical protein